MSSTLYSSGTVVTSPWLNDADTATYNYLTSVSGTNALTATGPVSLASYTAGDRFYLKPVITNTGAVTININGLGVQPITKNGSTNLVAGDLVLGNVYEIVYDGTLFQLLNPTNFGGLVPAANLTGQVAIANGGTGATTAAQARINLGTKVAGNYAGYQAITGTISLTVADIGQHFAASVVNPTVNLPLGSTLSVGDAYHFANSVVLVRSGSDQIVGYSGTLVNTVTTGGFPVTLIWRGSGVWSFSSGVARAQNANPGYSVLPGGILQQFGSSVVTTNAGGQQAVTFASPFSVAPYTVIVSMGDVSAPNILYHVQAGLTNTTFTIELRNSTTGALVPATAIRVNWVAFGPA